MFVVRMTWQIQVGIMIGVVVAKNEMVVFCHVLVSICLPLNAICCMHKFTQVQHRPIYKKQLTTNKAVGRIAFFVGDNCIDNCRATFDLAL